MELSPESFESTDFKSTEGATEEEDENQLLNCSVCLVWGNLNDSSKFTGDDINIVWKIHGSYEGIVAAGELPSKILAHFPQVPAERLDPSEAVICTSCFSVVQNVLQIEKQMLQVKSKLLVITPESKERVEQKKTKGSVEESNNIIQTRAKRKCALVGLSQDIINAELGYDKTEVNNSSPCPNDGGSSVDNSQLRKREWFVKCRAGGNSEKGKPLNSKNPRKTRAKRRSSLIDVSSNPAVTEQTTRGKSKRKVMDTSEKSTSSVVPSSTKGKEELDGRTDRTKFSKYSFFCCPKCCQYFAQENYQEFRNHLSEECFVKKRIPCRLCGHIYSTQNILDYHMIHVHENPHPKSKTMKTKPRKEYVDAVSKLMSKKPEGKDSLEVDNSNSETLLRNYKELEEDEWPEDEVEAEGIAARRGIWKCWICFYESKQKSLWNTHMNRIHPDVVGIPLTCDTCGIAFSKKFHLREHIHEVHADNTGYTCEDCGRKFMYKNMQHVCEKIQCNICGETFDTRGLKSKHMLIHPEYRPFKCELCPKEFQKREYLTIHMRVHNDIRPYGCEFCEKRFRSKSHYNNHRRLHTGEKPYVCHNCGRSFFSPQCLYNHLTSHTGNKNSVCNTCGKAFRTSNDLKRHEYIHSGEKPFACKFCGKCFNRRGNCSVHEKAHEVEGEFQCDVCHLRFEKLKKLEKHQLKIHTPFEGNAKAKGSKVNTKAKNSKQLSATSQAKSTNKVIPNEEPEAVPQPVAFIHLDDVASNVEISEGILVDEGVEEPVSLYQFSFEIDDNTLYCIQERRTDAIT